MPRRTTTQRQAAAKLLTERRLDLDDIGKSGLDFLLRETDTRSAENLREEVARHAAAAQAAVDSALSRLPGEA